MKIEVEIIDQLKRLTRAPMIVFPARVDDVNKDRFTCSVTDLDDVRLFDVRLKAGVEDISDGIVEIPSEGSSVLVALIGNNKNSAFIVKCSSVDEVLFYGGENGGLIKVNELVTQLEKVNQFIDTLKGSFQSAPPITPVDNGEAYLLYMDTLLSNMPTADFSNIENPKIKH